ncbi:MAG: hypothetical protein RLZZ408_1910, partial [Verrucomicrobiota bacterium]
MTKRSGSEDGEMLFGFDMAPVLPRRKEAPSVRQASPAPQACQAEAVPQPSASDFPPQIPTSGSQPPASKDPEVFSVSRLTRHIADLLEEGIGSVWVEGEISNLRVQSSGHSYFTLKDASSQLSCVLFARTASGIGI